MCFPHSSAELGIAQLAAVPHLRARWQQIIRTVPYARVGKVTKYKYFVTVFQLSVLFLRISFSEEFLTFVPYICSQISVLFYSSHWKTYLLILCLKVYKIYKYCLK